jgi:thiosulfate/3-mercaptopyruvate sulfurtransferase
MPRKVIARTLHPLFLYLLLLSLAVSGTLGGCNKSYDKPATTSTPTALIPAETLKGWIDAGKVNGTGYDRVVVLDVNSIGNYSAGHVPGAQFVDSNDIYQTRREGPANDVNMVPDGTRMNALIRKYGIDGTTTVVFTGGTGAGSASNYLAVTRAYWTFRYWGFPKERLKLLDGINSAWSAAYGLSTAPAPSVTPSTYSVTSNHVLRANLRASLSEMISAAEGNKPNAAIVDFRSGEADNSYAGQRGKTAGIFTSLTGTVSVSDFVVFEGHIRGARAMNYTTLFDAANSFRFKPETDLIALLAAVGINSSTTALVH